MFHHRIFLLCILWLTLPLKALASPDNTQLAVWANEAIVATFTYNHENFLTRQKEIAQYFTADSWIAYSKALKDAKLPETVKTNFYSVNAVATMPPTITSLKDHTWQAVMPILVIYKNPEYKQKQTLAIKINFKEVATGTGVRNLAITKLQATVAKAPCKCATKNPSKALA